MLSNSFDNNLDNNSTEGFLGDWLYLFHVTWNNSDFLHQTYKQNKTEGVLTLQVCQNVKREADFDTNDRQLTYNSVTLTLLVW